MESGRKDWQKTVKKESVKAAVGFWKKNNVWILGALIGVTAFLCIYGVHVLNVAYTDWLLGGGSLTQNYLGWCFYRNSDWMFPIGLMDEITYPNSVSVIYTDSVPLLAVFFKIFRGLLPEDFQYFGLWGLLCFGAQGAFGALLIFHYVKKKAEAVVGSLLFVLTPVMLGQVSVNMALGAQWLILLSLLLGIHRKEMSEKISALCWGLTGLLAAGSQLYFIPICALVLLSFLISDIFRRMKFRNDLAGLLAYLTASVGSVALLGGFAHDHIPDSSALGQAGFNLNGLFNSQGWSIVFPSLEVYGSNADEGLAFPGTGVLLTLATGCAAWLLRFLYKAVVKKEKNLFHFSWKKKENGVAYLILIVLSVLVAVSPTVAWGSSVAMQVDVPDWLLGLWRRVGMTGRFIWPVVYLVILGSVVWMEKEMPWEAMAAVLLVIFSVYQVYDGKWQLMQRQVQFSTDYSYVSPLEDGKWDKWAEGSEIEHMVFVSYMLEDVELMNELSVYAAENGMTVNDFGSSCQTVKLEMTENLAKELAQVREDTLYIYKMSDRDLCVNPEMEYVEVDGVIVGIAKT